MRHHPKPLELFPELRKEIDSDQIPFGAFLDLSDQPACLSTVRLGTAKAIINVDP